MHNHAYLTTYCTKNEHNCPSVPRLGVATKGVQMEAEFNCLHPHIKTLFLLAHDTRPFFLLQQIKIEII